MNVTPVSFRLFWCKDHFFMRPVFSTKHHRRCGWIRLVPLECSVASPGRRDCRRHVRHEDGRGVTSRLSRSCAEKSQLPSCKSCTCVRACVAAARILGKCANIATDSCVPGSYAKLMGHISFGILSTSRTTGKIVVPLFEPLRIQGTLNFQTIM